MPGSETAAEGPLLQQQAGPPEADLFTFEFDRSFVPWTKLFRYLRQLKIRKTNTVPTANCPGHEVQIRQTPVRRDPSSSGRRRLPDRYLPRFVLKAVAASAAAGVMLWLVPIAGRFGSELLHRRAAAGKRPPAEGAAVAGGIAISPALSPAPRDYSEHPLDWFRSAARKRAAIQLSESFDNGMASWGVPNRWAPGWRHSPDGYVRPGPLALFQPSLAYNDYRMEFFGEIEDKGLSWAVRGSDTRNYYAMKFHVVESGLRPIISLVHYPVVAGKRGHAVEVPLSVMTHNHTPYHVSVEVKGSHYRVSVEGEEVGAWSDDSLLDGGIGFFSEPGERARIYWVKVFHNDDWLGRLCEHIAAVGADPESALLESSLPSILPEPAAASAYLMRYSLN